MPHVAHGSIGQPLIYCCVLQVQGGWANTGGRGGVADSSCGMAVGCASLLLQQACRQSCIFNARQHLRISEERSPYLMLGIECICVCAWRKMQQDVSSLVYLLGT
jgi:hypothetical protein